MLGMVLREYLSDDDIAFCENAEGVLSRYSELIFRASMAHCLRIRMEHFETKQREIEKLERMYAE